MASYQFGATGATNVAEGTYGLLQNFNENESADESVALDASGNVADQQIYNKVSEITCEYVFDTTSSAPAVGDTVSIGTNNYTVMSVGKTETNNDYKKLSLTLKRYTSNGVPANA
jgi:hypothetical protein